MLSFEDLNKTESFVVYSLEKELKLQSRDIISQLLEFLKESATNGNLNSKEALKAFSILRFFRIKCIHPEDISKIEDFAINVLNNFSGEVRFHAFSLLFDYIRILQNNNDKYINDFFNSCINIIENCEREDIEFITLVLSNLEIFSLYNQKTPVIGFYDIIFNKIDFLLSNARNADFLKVHKTLIRKLLMAAFRFLSSHVKNPPEIYNKYLPRVIKIGQNIPDNVKFTQIYSFFLLLLTVFVDKSTDTENAKFAFNTIIQKEVLEKFPQFTLPPYNKSKRHYLTTCFVDSYIQSKTGKETKNLRYVWPLFFIPHCNKLYSYYAVSFIKEIYSANRSIDNHYFYINFIEQIIGCFQLLIFDFNAHQEEGKHEEFEVDIWINSASNAAKLVQFILSTEQQHDPSAPLNYLLRKFTEFYVFVIDAMRATQVIDSPEVTIPKHFLMYLAKHNFDKNLFLMTQIFIKVIASLTPNVMLIYLMQNLELLLPTKSYHQTYKIINIDIFRNIKHQIYYEVAFFSLINRKFDKLFADPLPILLDLVSSFFKEALSTDEKIQRFLKAPEAMFSDISSFIWKCLASGNMQLIELLLSLSQILFPLTNVNERLPIFVDQVRKSNHMLLYILIMLTTKYNELSEFTGFLALSFFPLCQNNIEVAETWTFLFFKALESDKYLCEAIRFLYHDISSILPQWIDHLPFNFRIRLIRVLSASLVKLPHKHIPFCKVLLSKIPKQTLSVCMLPADSKKANNFIKIDGVNIFPDELLKAIEADEGEDNLKILINLFNAMQDSIDPNEILNDKEFKEIAIKIHKLDPSFINKVCEGIKQEEKLYPMLILKAKLTEEIDVSEVQNKVNFCSFCCTFCTSKYFVKCALDIIKVLIEDIPISSVYAKICESIVRSSIYIYDESIKFFDEVFFQRIKSQMNEQTIKIVSCAELAIEPFLSGLNKLQRNATLHILVAFGTHFNEIEKVLISIAERFKSNPGIYMDRFQYVLHIDFSPIKNPEYVCGLYISILSDMHFPYYPDEIECIIGEMNCKEAWQIHSTHLLLRVLAKLLPIAASKMQKYDIYQKALYTIRRKEDGKFLPFFINILKKQGTQQLPKDLIYYVMIQNNGLPEIPANYYDALLIELATSVRGFTKVQEVVKWCAESLKMFYNTKLVDFQSRKTIQTILRIIKLIFKDDNRNGLIQLLAELITGAVYSMNMQYGYEGFPLAEACKHFPKTMFNSFVLLIKKKWSFCFLFLFLDLLKNPELSDFRDLAIGQLYEHTEEVIKFIKMQENDQFTFTVSSVINEFVSNISEYKTLNVYQCISIAIKTFNYVDFSPALYYPFLQILFPKDFASMFCIGSVYLEKLTNEIIPFVINNADYFFLSTSLDVFKQFLANIPKNSRDEIFGFIVSLSNIGEVGIKQAFIYAMCDCCCEVFNKTAACISCNLLGAPKEFSSLISLHFAYRLSQKGMRFEDPIFQENSSSLAFSVASGRGRYSDVKDLKRIIYSAKYQPATDTVKDGLTKAICAQMDHTPYTSRNALNLFNFIEGRPDLLDMNNEEFIKYAFILIRSVIIQKSNTHLKPSIYHLPHVLKRIPLDVNKKCNDAILEVFYKEIEDFLNKNEQFVTIKHYVAEMKPYLERRSDYIDISQLFTKMSQRMFTKISERVSSQDYTTMLMIFANLGKFFVKRDDPIPPIFTPTRIMVPYIKKEQLDLFKKAIETIDETVGIEIPRKLVKAYHTEFKNDKEPLEEPLEYPFATVAQWVRQAENHRLYNNIFALFEALAPHNLIDFVNSVKAMKDPFVPEVLTYLKTVCRERFFPKYQYFIETNTATLFLFAKKSKNLLQDLWTQRWLDIPKAMHLRLFAKMLFPEWLGEKTDFMSEEAVKKLVSIAVIEMDDEKGYRRWFMHYLQLNIDSQLKEALWSLNILRKANPIPFGSIDENKEYLNTINLCDDALGIIKTEFPELFKAITYHQLSNYEAAKHEYLNAMSENPDSYSFALLELKQVSYNVDLIKAKESSRHVVYNETFKVIPTSGNSKPAIAIPFFMNNTKSQEFKKIYSHVCDPKNFTSFLSQTYFPYLTRCALSEEAFKCLGVLHDMNPANSGKMIDQLILPWNNQWMKSLDKLTSTISNICWRLTVVDKLMKRQLSEESKEKLKQVAMKNHTDLAILLEKSGAISKGLKQLTVFTAPAAKFIVNSASLGRVLKFLRTPEGSKYHEVLYDTMIALRDFRVNEINNRRWLKFFIEFFNEFPSKANIGIVIEKISLELNNGRNMRKFSMYAFVIFAIAKKFPDAVPLINQELFKSQQSQERKNLWIKYLPLIIKYCGAPSKEFLISLLDKNNLYFLMTLKTIGRYGNAERNTVSEIAKLLADNRTWAKANTKFQDEYSWIIECAEDINKLDISVMSHLTLLRMIKDPNFKPNEIVEKAAGGSSFEKIAEYCIINPPVFKTDVRETTKFQMGVKFIYNIKTTTSITIKADGEEEAYFRVLNINGEVNYFSILSSKVYKFNIFEDLFNEMVNKYIHKHMSNVPRVQFSSIFGPFTVHPSLTIVNFKAIPSFPSVLHKTVLERIKAHGPLKDLSPYESYERSKEITEKEKSNLRDLFIKGSNGNFIDFLAIRHLFASSLAENSVMNLIFKTGLPEIPNFCICSKKFFFMSPGYLFSGSKPRDITIPLTESSLWLLPKFVLHGSFTTTFLSTCEALSSHKEKLKIILSVLREGVIGGGNENTTKELIERLDSITPAVSEDTEKTSLEFPFALVDHLISEASNRNAEFNSFLWI